MRVSSGVRLSSRLCAAALAVVVFLAVFAVAGCGQTLPEETVEQVDQQAGQAARSANLKMIDQAIEIFRVNQGEYPDNINQLVPEYMTEIPEDPSGGTYCLVEEDGVVRAAVK